MSAKLIGALLIFAAGALLFLQCRRQSRGELLFLQDMASALEQMEAAIRFRRLSMPDLLAEQTKRAYCGQVFTQVEQHMKSGSTLQDSWELAADAVPWKQGKSILAALELSGDAQRIGDNLRLAALSLRDLVCQRQAGRHERQKMILALTASGCGLLVILLL